MSHTESQFNTDFAWIQQNGPPGGMGIWTPCQACLWVKAFDMSLHATNTPVQSVVAKHDYHSHLPFHVPDDI
eukprot:scaffold455019_cov36-Prasinocladus_malaysianus.AAC.1